MDAQWTEIPPTSEALLFVAYRGDYKKKIDRDGRETVY
jgi:hypothetical protein